MDPFKYTFVGHEGLDHCNPVSPPQIESLIDPIDLPRGGLAVDIGCGKAELLLRLIERCGVRGIGVDRSPFMIEEARRRGAARAPGGTLELHQIDAGVYTPVEPPALAACLGATECLGGLVATLTRFAGWVRPGGYVLIGEGHWRREPEPAFLHAMGARPGDYLRPDAIEAAGVAAGLRPVRTILASLEEFDRYEAHHASRIEAYAVAHASDPDAAAMLARRRGWTDLYRRWGRETLSFGLHLFRRG